MRIAIPDFHLINENKIVEVKSKYTFSKQNLIDKVKIYEKLGYEVAIMYEGKEYSPQEIDNINENEFTIENCRK